MSGIKQVVELDESCQRFLEEKCGAPVQGQKKIECVMVLRSDGEISLLHPRNETPRDCPGTREIQDRIAALNKTEAEVKKTIEVWHFESYCIKIGGEIKCFP